ncbi:MAG TPA: hypothetical protein VD969_03480 [Symbiobacteriaceae bacterium]|nr:hypothetical protein [Symbiobacteriaceae bacterium]
MRQALRWAEERRRGRVVVGAWALIALGELLREQGELSEAERCLLEGLDRGLGWCTPAAIVQGYVSLANSTWPSR